MKPILYSPDERAFVSNGLGRLYDLSSCTVTEERNGVYECEFTISVTSEMYPLIQEGRYIAVPHDDKADIQPFEIYGRSAPINGIVTFHARHISYKLSNIIVKPFTASSCAQALSKLESETYNDQLFTFWTDKNVSATFESDVPASCRSLLAGQAGSILDVYGTGEYEFDKWEVKLHLHRGVDNGVAIRYGINLTDIKQDIDESSSYNAVAPFWKSEEDGTVVTLPEGIVVTSTVQTRRIPWTTETGEYITDDEWNIIEYNVPIYKPVVLDLTTEFENEPTVQQLRSRAIQVLQSSNAWLPTESITVSFVDLAHTEEYKSISALQRVSLCDRVSVYCGPLGVNAVSMQVVRTVYNVLTETYNEIELGAPRTNFSDAVAASMDTTLANMPTNSAMKAAISHATKMITGGLGGYVVLKPNADGQPEELLIMDTPDPLTAVNVWRFNKNGLGHSHNGYNGPFNDVALTADGKINASMITTGYMLATLIRGGTLLLGGLDNQNGVFEMRDGSNGVIGTWNKDGIDIKKGSINIAGAGQWSGNVQINSNRHAFFVNSGDLSSSIDADGIVVANGDPANGLQSLGRYTLITPSWVNAKVTDSDCYPDWRIENEVNHYELVLSTSPSLFRLYMDDSSDLNSLPKIDFQIGGSNAHVYFRTSLNVTGTKSRVVSTDQYSDRLLYCYETPSPMFGDVGEGVIGEDGLCYISLDPVFAQTITTRQYQVFLQKYGSGDAWVKERKGSYFVVEGTPNMAFGWEIKAKQADYDQRRLDKAEQPYSPPRQTYGADAAQYINNLRKERISE